jgi:exoribonuclease R
MKLYTKDYLRFKILDNGICVKEFEGVELASKALPGDEVSIDGSLIKRTEHPPLVGVIHLQSKIKYGMTTRGYPIYLFEPLNKAYPLMIVGSSEKGVTTNMLGLAKFESWTDKYPRANLTRIIGPCGDPAVEAESLLLRYSPWSYPKVFEISPKYSEALTSRPLCKGFTFNIDPPGCEDVDDVFTVEMIDKDTYILTISITDVATAIEEGTTLDLYAQKVGQSLYPPDTKPKHMLPPSLGTKELSLGIAQTRNCISLGIRWSQLKGIIETTWAMAKIAVDKAYTYKEAQSESRPEFQIMKSIVNDIAGKPITTSEEWVETLMIYYNKEAGKLLKTHGTGILRSHSAPDQEKLLQWVSIDPSLEKLAYSSATYCAPDTDTTHWGLGLTDYTHASSPLRRYADLYNQRCLIEILEGINVNKRTTNELCNELNLLGKAAKAFERNTFFLQALSTKGSAQGLEGRVLEIQEEKQAIQLWVPTWNRLIRVKCAILNGSVIPKDGDEAYPIAVGQVISLKFYVQYQNARWKDKIIFSITPLGGIP